MTRWLGKVISVFAIGLGACSLQSSRSNRFLRVESPRAYVLSSGIGVLYFDVANDGPIPDCLERVDVTGAADAQLHEVVESGGISRMDPAPKGFVVPAFSTLRLRHGGKHVMLFGAQGGGATMRAVARFKNAGPVPFDAVLAEGSSS